MKKKIILLVSILSLTVTIFAVTFGAVFGRNKVDSVAIQLELGNRYMSELNYEQAIVTYEAILEIDPKCEEAYIAMAEAYLSKGDREKALEVLRMGYAKTESNMIRNQIEFLKEILASNDMNEKDEPEDNATTNQDAELTNSEESNASDWDTRYDACVVDGVERQGYAKFDLSDEEINWLKKIVEMAESGLYEDLFPYAEEEKIASLLTERYTTDYKLMIAFRGYKIGVDCFASAFEISIIPLDDGMGYILSNLGYIECECAGGMFDGKFRSSEYINIGDGMFEKFRDQYGSVKNGMFDGEIRSIHYNPDPIDNGYYVTFYEIGKPVIFGTPYYEDGFYIVFNGYETDANWNRIDSEVMLKYYATSQESFDASRTVLGSSQIVMGRKDIYCSLPW